MTNAVVRGAFAVLLGILLLSGCSTGPVFEPPIEWAGAKRSTDIEYSAPISVRLEANGSAWLSDFPPGTSVEDEDGFVCLERAEGMSYTGPATWSSPNGHSVVVEFEDSVVTLSTEQERFDGQNWTEVVFRYCGSDLWVIKHTCGQTNFGNLRDEPCPARRED